MSFADAVSHQPSGILLIDKPPGESSFAALYPVKRAFGGKKGAKIGHAGTLDPAASGLLVIGVGSGTRLLEFLEAMPKRYSFRLNLGVVTDSYDLEGEVLERHDAAHVTRAALEALIPEFLGPISQIPPTYSAIKIDGKRAYERARDGEALTMAARDVRIDRIEILSFEPGNITLEMDCSKGTYVRSLAHDLGKRLGCGAAADRIRRLRIGPFRVEDAVAVSPETDPDDFTAGLLPLETAVTHLPAVQVNGAWLPALRNGNVVSPDGWSFRATGLQPSTPLVTPRSANICAAFDEAGNLLAIGELDLAESFCPRKVFPEAGGAA